MHIAVFDDNIADRKQLERLLGRESDRRIPTTGNLYIDSHGNFESLLHAPMQYELFFIDCHSGDKNGMDVARMLRKAGVTAPIVMCSGETDYTAISAAPELLLHIKKPIQKDALSAIIDEALEIHTHIERPITIQGEKETIYLHERDILYANEYHHTMHIHTASGKVHSTLGRVMDLIITLEDNPRFFRTEKTCIVNLTHVTEIHFGKIVFDTQEKLSFPFWQTEHIKRLHHYVKMHEG